jgi:hypothetical protein
MLRRRSARLLCTRHARVIQRKNSNISLLILRDTTRDIFLAQDDMTNAGILCRQFDAALRTTLAEKRRAKKLHVSVIGIILPRLVKKCVVLL